LNVRYLYPKQISYLHEQILQLTGGRLGVRDERLLESAIYRPQSTFGSQDLYPDLFGKTAALGHSIISNHPFIDGNKRVGYEAMRLMLRLNGFDIQGSVDEKYKFVMQIAEGKTTDQEIANWLRKKSEPYKPG
jgi:death on curing protein